MTSTRSLIAFIVVSVGLAGCGQAAQQSAVNSTDAPGTQQSTSPPIFGGTPQQDQTLQQVFQGLGAKPTPITELDIGSPPEQFNAAPSDEWLAIAIPAGDSHQNQFAEWQAGVVAGAFRDLSQAQSLPPIAGYTIPDQSSIIVSAGASVLSSPPSVDEISSRLQSMGLQVDSISALHPDSGVAYVVNATASDPASFVGKFGADAASQAFGDLSQYEGTFLEVDDQSGAPILITWQATRVQQGAGWITPSLESGDGGCQGLDTTCGFTPISKALTRPLDPAAAGPGRRTTVGPHRLTLRTPGSAS